MKAQELVLSMKAEAELEVQKFDELSAALVVDLKESEDKGYQQALDDQKVPKEDKIYSQVDMDNEVNPLKASVAALETRVSELEVSSAQAVAAKQAEMLADFKSADIDNDAVIAKYEI